MKIVINPAALKKMDKRLDDTLEIIGAFIEGEAKDRCPVDTGNLRQSINHKVVSKKVIIGTNSEYAARIEFGFAGADILGRIYDQPAQPYLRPALLENKKKILELIKKHVFSGAYEVEDTNEIINLK